jgi:hypothetical protein
MMEDAMAIRKRASPQAALSLTHPNAAGIDIGSASHFVAVPPDRDDEPVREFSSFTIDLHRLADWLDACNVDTVAMESTGVYWIPLYELLESRGFTVPSLQSGKVAPELVVHALDGEGVGLARLTLFLLEDSVVGVPEVAGVSELRAARNLRTHVAGCSGVATAQSPPEYFSGRAINSPPEPNISFFSDT